MSDENRDDLIVIHTPGLVTLPDGSWELKAEAPTEVHHVTLPESLCIGDMMLYKTSWDPETKYTLYRSGWSISEEAMRHLM